MSNRYGQVLKTLATKGNQAVLAAGQPLSALAEGQIGFFSYPGDIALAGTENVRDFYIGVGVSPEEVNYSGGQFIQTRNIQNVSFRPHTASREQITIIKDFCGSCDENYILNVQFENQEIYRHQGFVQFSKNYSFVTPCCSKCGCDCSCSTGDCNLIVKGLVEAVNDDKDQLLKATPLDDTGAPIADIDAWIATQEAAADADKKCAQIQLEGLPNGMRSNCGLNLNHFYPRGTSFKVYPKSGFECNFSQETTQEVGYEEGHGHDVLHREMVHATNNAGASSHYYTSPNTGLPTEFPTMADSSVMYDQFAIETFHRTESGWLEYENAVGTILAIPEADTVTRDGVATVLTAITGNTVLGFDELVSDAAAANVDPTAQEKTEDKGEANDGMTS